MSDYEFLLPDVGEGLREGEVVKWHVAPGDTVNADQIIVDVQTDKAIVEIPSPVSGTIVSLGGEPNDVLPIGAVLAVIATGAAASARSGQSPEVPAESIEVPQAPAPGSSPPAPGATVASKLVGRALASPATRKLARTLGIDLTQIRGTGSRGQITRADVERFAERGQVRAAASESAAAPAAAMPPAPAVPAPVGEDRVEPLRGLRRQIARSMEQAWRSVPHIFSMDDIDATELVRARASLNDELGSRGIKLSYMPFFVKACVAALMAHPRFNASLDMEREEIIYRHRYNIGVATATPDGLIVTVVHDADRKGLVEIGEEIASLRALARERRVSLEQLSQGTFTISNYGSYGGLMGTPIIRPPEVAIAGFGRLHEAVVPVDGQPAVRMRLPFCVSTDHRINDGEHMGAFIDVMTRTLQDPVRLLGHP
ncbi:MAG: dihydrolipoamide acetyltransferase family protein [Thiotrichales bacterium]|nr:dihydrolipoamide acetyltransferase family protein [Thiotrichales bacterium]